MSKYFNTEILRMMVAQAPVDGQDLNNDRFAALDPAGQYLLYVSDDPLKELHPRTVKKTLRYLFKEEVHPHGCIVRIREEIFQEEDEWQNQPESQDKSLRKEDSTVTNCENWWKPVPGGLSGDNSFETPTTDTAKSAERARGGLNITFDPKMLFENDSWTNWSEKANAPVKILHHNPKPIGSSHTSVDGKTMVEEAKNHKDDEQQSHEETPPEERQEQEPQSQMPIRQRIQLYTETVKQCLRDGLAELAGLQLGHVELPKIYFGAISADDSEDGDDDVDKVVQWLSQNSFISAHTIPVTERRQVSHLEKFRGGLRCCLRTIGNFFSTGEQEDSPSRPYVDHQHPAPLVLGPSIDESMVFLADRLMLAINWAMQAEESPQEIQEQLL
ncbi:hypothetical protein KR084_003315, partial [Drosophila pseudotakahashii]